MNWGRIRRERARIFEGPGRGRDGGNHPARAYALEAGIRTAGDLVAWRREKTFNRRTALMASAIGRPGQILPGLS